MTTRYGYLINKWTVLAAVALVVLVAVMATAMPVGAQDNDTIKYAENGTDPVATFTATDPDDDKVTWRLGGIDEEDFDISEDGVLTFDVGGDSDTPDASVSPDFEDEGDNDSNNKYEVTVTAESPDGTANNTNNTDTEALTVEVTDVAEDGKVTWTVAIGVNEATDTPLPQFIVGAALVAAVTDGDDIADNTTRYQWYRSSSRTSQGTAISDATTNMYAVLSDDVGSYIRVVAYYYEEKDPIQKSAYLVSDHRVLGNFPAGNDAPEFDPTAVDREINEGDAGMAVGARVTATGGHGALTYALPDTGTDNSKFEIDEKTGQIKNMVDLNYEGVDGGDDQCAAANACVVTVTATDAAGRESDEATVNIKINSVDEKPYFDSNVDTGIQDPAAKVDHDENVEVVDATDAVYTASDPDMGSVNYALMGADGNLFTLNNEKMLRFKTAPDHENPMDRNRDNVYEVTVRASDGTMTEDWMVEVTVTDMNEDPMIAELNGSIEYAENGTDPVATFTATDPDDDKVTWRLGGIDEEDFDISEDGVLTFDVGGDSDTPDASVSPDFEDEGDNDSNNKYEVTVTAESPDGTANNTNNTDTEALTVEVTDVAEDGKVTWTVAIGGHAAEDTPQLTQFIVGAALVAAVTDGDGTVDNTTRYQWYRSSSRTSQGTAISDATTNMYAVLSDDVGSYIPREGFVRRDSYPN